MAAQLLTRAWSALSKCNGLGNFQTTYGSCFIYDSPEASLHILMSCSDDFEPFSQQKSPYGVERRVETTKVEVACVAWERTGSLDHAMRRLTLPPFSHLHTLLGNIVSKPLKMKSCCSAMRSDSCRVPLGFFPAVFLLLSHEVAEALHIQQPAVERPRVIELNNKENAVRSLATAADVVIFLEDH